MKVSLVPVVDFNKFPRDSLHEVFCPYDASIASNHYIAIVSMNFESSCDVINSCANFQIQRTCMLIQTFGHADMQTNPKPMYAPSVENVYNAIQDAARKISESYNIWRVIIVFPSLYDMGVGRMILRSWFCLSSPSSVSSRLSLFRMQLEECFRDKQRNTPKVSTPMSRKEVEWKNGNVVVGVIDNIIA